jgi:hypothetical protein
MMGWPHALSELGAEPWRHGHTSDATGVVALRRGCAGGRGNLGEANGAVSGTREALRRELASAQVNMALIGMVAKKCQNWRLAGRESRRGGLGRQGD